MNSDRTLDVKNIMNLNFGRIYKYENGHLFQCPFSYLYQIKSVINRG